MRTIEERNALAEQHRWLVPWVVRRLYLMNLDEEDAVSEGYVSLLKVAKAYDPARGKFTTLAVRTIRRDVLAADFMGGAIYLPQWLRWQSSRNHPLQSQAARCRGVRTLERLPGLEPVLACEKEGEDYRADLLPALAQAMARLPTADRELLRARFWAGRHLRELGRDLGISQEGVRQRQERALRRLRAIMESDLAMEIGT